MRAKHHACRTARFRGAFLWLHPEERDGGKPGTGGFSEWAAFAPRATVYTLNHGRCFHVRLSGGHARAFVLYNQGRTWVGNILAHERHHVLAHLAPAYRDYQAAAAALGRPCMTRQQAQRIRALILHELKHEFVARSYRDGTRSDWQTYGRFADPDARRDSWRRMMTSARQYAAAHRATQAAVRLARSAGKRPV